MFVIFMPLHILFVLMSALDFMWQLGTIQNPNMFRIQIGLLYTKFWGTRKVFLVSK
jgi:hypothetical protein